ncbi:MAG: sulfite exporter TauE/SafE family protein [Treponema sp.]|jgi:sulfite exporter TauE/SafE/copper chaperone CopZ|nr:sulfite exporter TauE/SafE family protein [Treponema sp.]
MVKPDLKSGTLRIGGMSCVNCRNRIEEKLKSTAGVEGATVNFNTGMASLSWDASVISLNEIKAAIEALDYQVLDGKGGRPSSAGRLPEITGTLVIILALYLLGRALGLNALSSAFPLAEAGMGYGMLFVIGLAASAHCAAMCGGINLSQCIAPPALPGEAALPPPGKRREALFPALLYNAGRALSYTAAGALAGALGSALTVSGRFQGLVQLAAGFFMVIMGINMLGFFPFLRRLSPALPGIFTRKTGGQRPGRNPLFIGLLNGLMPCGPLQAMQLYALSTGNPLAGGISLFLFCMGTVPLMFGIGALASLLGNTAGSPAFRRRVTRGGAILITVTGMTMFSYGFSLSGFSPDFSGGAVSALSSVAARAGRKGAGLPAAGAETPLRIENGVQIVSSTLGGGFYPAITVRQGIPVKWTIDAPAGSINGCNNRMIIREYGIEYRFNPGENLIEFTPAKTGRFLYSCWMGMIRSSITVVEEGQSLTGTGGGAHKPSPAGAAIPTDRIVLAELAEDGSRQTARTALKDEGIDPAILVMRRGVPAEWIINNDSPDPGNSRLIFPAWRARLDIEQGDNTLRFTPLEDFTFSTDDSVFYGYVKVTEDLNNVDIDALKAEVSAYETLIYPGPYFEAAEAAAQGAGQYLY